MRVARMRSSSTLFPSNGDPTRGVWGLVMTIIVIAVVVLNVSSITSHHRGYVVPRQAAQEQLLAKVCPVFSGRLSSRRAGTTMRSVFVGDSTALQAMRMSVTAALACTTDVDTSERGAATQAVAALHKRLASAKSIEKLSVATISGSRWEFWFIKSRYLYELEAVMHAAQLWDVGTHQLSHLDVFVAVGTWDATRPTPTYSGLKLDNATTRTDARWKRALVNFSFTVHSHAEHLAGVINLPDLPTGRLRMLLPMLPNCSAHKFHRVGVRPLSTPERTVLDPYTFVQGRNCRRRLVLGTTPIVRDALLRAASAISGFQVLDYQSLLAAHPADASSSHDGVVAPTYCKASDGAHLDDVAVPLPLLTPCTVRLLHALWVDRESSQ